MFQLPSCVSCVLGRCGSPVLKCRHYPLLTFLFPVCTALMLSQCGGFVPPDYRVDVVLMSIAQLFLRWSSAPLDWCMLPAQWGTTIWTQWDGNSGKTGGLLLHWSLRLEQQVGKWKGQFVLKRQGISFSVSYIWGGKTKHQFSSWEEKKHQAYKKACKEGGSTALSFDKMKHLSLAQVGNYVTGPTSTQV